MLKREIDSSANPDKGAIPRLFGLGTHSALAELSKKLALQRAGLARVFLAGGGAEWLLRLLPPEEQRGCLCLLRKAEFIQQTAGSRAAVWCFHAEVLWMQRLPSGASVGSAAELEARSRELRK